MARKPSYDFERREREKAKALKAAERVKAKTEKSKPHGEGAQESGDDPKATSLAGGAPRGSEP